MVFILPVVGNVLNADNQNIQPAETAGQVVHQKIP